MLTIEEKKRSLKLTSQQIRIESNSTTTTSSPGRSPNTISFLANPIKYDPYKSLNSTNQQQNSKKILIQNQQGFYINATNGTNNHNNNNTNLNNSSPQQQSLGMNSNSLNNQRCSDQFESKTTEFIEQNGNKTQKVSV